MVFKLEILKSLSPDYWDDRCVLPHLARNTAVEQEWMSTVLCLARDHSNGSHRGHTSGICSPVSFLASHGYQPG